MALLVILALIRSSADDSPAWLQAQAELAAHAGDWATAVRYWRAINATKSASSTSLYEEARACLALGQAAQAEHSLNRAINADPTNPEPWKLLLQILRVENRAIDAQQLGWKAYDQVRPEARREILRELTLALLGDLPDDLVRSTLTRWVDADSEDITARTALWQRMTDQPRAADPDRPAILSALEDLLAKHPADIGAREALVTALANAGEPDRGRAVLDDWPQASRDARFWRLRGRWDLEYDHRPEKATTAFQKSLEELRTIGGLGTGWRVPGEFSIARVKAVWLPKWKVAFVKYSIHSFWSRGSMPRSSTWTISAHFVTWPHSASKLD